MLRKRLGGRKGTWWPWVKPGETLSNIKGSVGAVLFSAPIFNTNVTLIE